MKCAFAVYSYIYCKCVFSAFIKISKCFFVSLMLLFVLDYIEQAILCSLYELNLSSSQRLNIFKKVMQWPCVCLCFHVKLVLCCCKSQCRSRTRGNNTITARGWHHTPWINDLNVCRLFYPAASTRRDFSPSVRVTQPEWIVGNEAEDQ